MDFSFTEEQRMLADTVGRYIDQEYTFEARKQTLKHPRESFEQHWTQFAELGLLGVNIPQEYGGLGGEAVESLIVMEAFGRGLVVEPYLATAIGATTLIRQAGSDVQKEAMLTAIIAGNLRIALALHEPDKRYDLSPQSTTASPDGNGFVLNGTKTVVLGGNAEQLILAARTGDKSDDESGVTLFCVPCNAAGFEIEEFPNLDGQRSAEIRLRAVHVPADAVLGEVGKGYLVLERVVDRIVAALCAEAVGAMVRLFEMTIQYLKTRKQFGQPLGSLQALQHRAVELLTLVERSRSMALFAASRANNADPAERRRAVSAAKAFIGRASRRLVKEAIQMHGGIGMTEEMSVSHYARRLLCIDLTLGDAAYHTTRFADNSADAD